MNKRMKATLRTTLGLAIFTSSLHFPRITLTVSANETCTGIAQCIEIQNNARDKISSLLDQEEELSDQIAELNTEITGLRQEIEAAELSIERTTRRINALQEEIEKNRQLLEETQEEIEGLKEVIGTRIAITHRLENTTSLLTLITESNSLADFISELRTMNRWVENDAELMDQLNDLFDKYDHLIITLNDQANALIKERESLEEQQKTLEAKQEALLIKEGNLRASLEDVSAQRMSEEEALKAAEQAQRILEAQAASSNNSNRGNTSSAAGNLPATSGMISPLPGGIVTSEFGGSPWRPGGFHTGIDVALPGNPAIIAPADGRVIFNGWHSINGYYLIIAHNIDGQRVDTLYAHLASRAPVEAGADVVQGQVIGTQGNTGFSFGAHLHFEVHPGGFNFSNWGASAVNPREWVNF